MAVIALEHVEHLTALLPLIVTTLAPGPSIISGPAVSFSSSVLESLIVCGLAALKTVGSNWIRLPGGIGVGVGLGDAVEQVARVVRARAGIAREVDGKDRRRAGEQGASLECFQHRDPATVRGTDASR